MFRFVAILAAASASAAVLAPATAQTPETAAVFDAYRGERSNGWTGQTRSEVVAANGMVATSHPLAVNAGLDILKAGGNAFDAAVAMAAVLNVVEPGSAGIGGDAFVIAWSAKENKLVALDGSGRAPSGATIKRLKSKGFKAVPYTGIEASVIPGVVDAWDVLLKRYGTRDFKTVLEPAATIAEQGFGITERIGRDLANDGEIIGFDAETTRVYWPGGVTPPLYSLFKNPDLGKAFRVLQTQGRDGFYKGPIRDAILKRSQALGGAIVAADFDKISAKWVETVSTSYQGHVVHEMPPSTQGFAVLEMLNIVEQCAPVLGIDVAKAGPKSADYWHLMIEAKKLAYSDLHRHNGDPEFSPVPTDRLTSKDHARSLCAKIDLARATKPEAAPEPIGGTVYLTAADKEGNIVSFIYSIYGEFGSGITVPGFGFVMNNRAAEFSLDPKSPNAIAPGKRPFYTIIPAFVTKDGKPHMAVGLMGGDQQVQGHAQVLVNMLQFGANPQAASDAARFNHSQRTNKLLLEGELFEAIGAEMKARGHDVERGTGRRMGGYQAIMIDPDSGLYRSGSDHRKDGMAIGY